MANIHSSQAPVPVGPYPHAKRVGRWLFLSGVGPRSPDNNLVPGNEEDANGRLIRYDIRAQCHAVMSNVAAVMESAGARLTDLVDITVFLTDMNRDFGTFNEVYSEYFDAEGPCRTTIEVGALPTQIAIELKCIAYLGGDELA